MLVVSTLGYLAALSLSAQSANISIYNGSSLAQLGIRAVPWGGGKLKEVTTNSFAGGHSLEIMTSGQHTGGILIFGGPVKLADAFRNKENVLQVTVYVVPNAAGTSSAPVRQIEKFRVVIRTSDNKMSEALIPATGSNGRWRQFGVPLSSIGGFSKTNQEVVGMAIGGDAVGTFYLGEVRVVTDQTPIQGFLGSQSMLVARDQQVDFKASAEAGLTAVEYVWDFNEGDGLQDDAIGQVVMHKYRSKGEYTVTLTIRDIYGIKRPWVGRMKVSVSE